MQEGGRLGGFEPANLRFSSLAALSSTIQGCRQIFEKGGYVGDVLTEIC